MFMFLYEDLRLSQNSP